MTIIKLKSSDNQIFSVDLKAARLSLYIQEWLDDVDYTEGDDDPRIILPNIKGSVLKKIVDWTTYHKDDTPYNELKDSKKKICEWDKQFFKIDDGYFLFEIILAAHKLNIPGLINVATRRASKMFNGKSLEELSKLYFERGDKANATGEKSVDANEATDTSAGGSKESKADKKESKME